MSRRLAPFLMLFASLAVALPVAAGPPRSNYGARPDVREFVDELAREHGFSRAALRRLFTQVRPQQSVIDAMQRPLLEPPKWYEYARPFLAPARIQGGVRWWSAHADALARAETRYGVPAEVIVAIVGVETYYGRNVGRYRALDALATLAFDYPRRAMFFRTELREFLLLARELGVSPLLPKGSFAGALGIPQFMPGSYRRFAVDFDGSGRADLWTSAPDVAASIANFLVEHGWQSGQPVLLAAQLSDLGRAAALERLEGGISQPQSQALWAEAGVAAVDAPPGFEGENVGLLSLEEDSGNADGASYWIACNNFYVLTRYNRSRLYATAVYELAKAIRRVREEAKP